jgi:hypothetical protein
MQKLFSHGARRFEFCGLEPLGLECAVLCVGQEVRPRTSGEKEPSRYSPLGVRCGAWLLKKLCSDCEAGLASNGETSAGACSPGPRVSRTIEPFFCTKGAVAIRESPRSKTKTPRGGRRRRDQSRYPAIESPMKIPAAQASKTAGTLTPLRAGTVFSPLGSPSETRSTGAMN